MGLTEIMEGRTRLLVPRESLNAEVPPTFPMFFNPAAALNRDVSVAMTKAASGSTFCDAMSGVGARGLRIANEAGNVEFVALVDFNANALAAAEGAARANGISGKCQFVPSETRTFLNSRYGKDEKFDFVDIDPFGTPAGFVQAASLAVADGGILSATATDTAVLCGVYPDVCKRRYGSVPLNTSFHHETAVRILLGFIARVAASSDLGTSSVAAHATRHYLRVYARLRHGASKADQSLGKLGYVVVCNACGLIEASEFPEPDCSNCRSKTKISGPLWLGHLTEPTILKEAESAADEAGLRAAAQALRSLGKVDSFPPWSHTIEEVCSKLRIASVPYAKVSEELAKAGHSSSRQPFERTGVKTDARSEEVVDAVRSSAAFMKQRQN